MHRAVGVRFRNNPKVYYFDPGELRLMLGARVIVQTEMGLSMGAVVKGAQVADDEAPGLKAILRAATPEDLQKERDNEAWLKEAREFFGERTMARGLPMKILATEATLDRKRLLFYFVAESRIDFRELVKDLAARFRTRIELRQVGVRDVARIVGGFGICGREFCCSSFLNNFAPISIKMAKQQGLVLNTCKLSGQCGRLMCCLNYEYEEGAPPPRQRVRQQREAAAVTAPDELLRDVQEIQPVAMPEEAAGAVQAGRARGGGPRRRGAQHQGAASGPATGDAAPGAARAAAHGEQGSKQPEALERRPERRRRQRPPRGGERPGGEARQQAGPDASQSPVGQAASPGEQQPSQRPRKRRPRRRGGPQGQDKPKETQP